ncbi:MAG: response regulator transcription factor [Deltaproteobacteria bacterium]
MEKKILTVDDEKDILNVLEYNLGKAGFKVISADDGTKALAIAKKEIPDLIILDIMLPGMEGTEVLKAIKKDKLTEKIPVIMLTARGEEIDRVLGFELGADDYVVKPFSPKELSLRVNALLKTRHHEKDAANNKISFGGLLIDVNRFAAYVGKENIGLTATEFRLLVELARSKGRVLSRDYLVRTVCRADSHLSFRNIDTHVRMLRAKLERWSPCVETVRGLGYRFNKDIFNRKKH